MNRDKIQEFTLRITTANRTEMMAILYDIGIEYLNDAMSYLAEKEYENFNAVLVKFRGVLRELMNSVNNENDLGRVFLGLYIFISQEVTKAFIHREKEPLEHIKGMFTRMSEAYKEAAKSDTTGPVMEHAETVYAGLTYNKNSMAESVNNRDMSRGFLA